MRLLIQRYLAAQFILPLLVSTVFFICFLLTFELFKMTDLLVTRDISLWFTLGLIGNITLTFIPLSIPIAVFFSTIFCVNRMSADSEYIAMRAGGLTKERIVLPFLVVASILTVSIYHLNQTLIPASNKEFKKKITYLTSSGLLAGIKEGQFFTMIPNVTLFASHATKYGRNLEEVFLHLKEKGGQERVILSKRGELIFEKNPDQMSDKLTLSLFDGNIIGQGKAKSLEKIIFAKYSFPITQGQFGDKFSLKETMLSSEELGQILAMSPEEALKLYRFNKKDLFNARYEFWNRKNGAVICFVFCLLGFSLGISGNRGKGRNSGLTGLMCLIVYYGIFFSLVGVARKEIIPTPLAVFIPAIVLSFVAVYFYRKLDWQS
jgi:lipopolysaccharide export LptBFGC system permease protein LptF